MMRIAHTRFVAAATAIVLVLPLTASAYENGLYVGLEGGVNWENSQNLKDDAAATIKFKPGFIGGINVGNALENGFRPELEVDFRRDQLRKANVTGVGSVEADGFQNVESGMLNLWYDVKTETGIFSKIHPYVGGGVGLSNVRFQSVTATGIPFVNNKNDLFVFQGGAGIGYEINKHLITSLDYRYFQSKLGNFATNDIPGDVTATYRSNSLLASIRYNFGRPPKPVLAESAPAYVPPPPPPPAGPCRDSDGDGVCDAVDKCPGTPKGFKVDADGCIIDQKIILRGVNFEFNKDKLTAPAETTLDQVGAALVGQPSLRVEIAGYTDSVGSAAYNLALSKKRAAAVKNYLVSKGVPASNLVSQGYGKASPIATNDTEEGRAENRRVEFSVLNKPANADVVTKGSTEASKSAAEGDPVGKKVMQKKKHHRKVKAEMSSKPTAQ